MHKNNYRDMHTGGLHGVDQCRWPKINGRMDGNSFLPPWRCKNLGF